MVSPAGGGASFPSSGAPGAKRGGEASPPSEKPRAKTRHPWRKLLLAVGGLVALAGVATAAGLGFMYARFSADLPPRLDVVTDYRPLRATEIFSADGELIGQFFIEKRVLAPMPDIPASLKRAFVAAEDNRFYQHRGIDYLGIVRASLANLRAGRVVQGGSTITQQVAKLLLTGKERSLSRKVREAILAHRIERRLDKEQILGIYLNHVYLGHGAYGVVAAAQTYFGKDLQSLSNAEAAMLAGLPKAPGNATPFHDVAKATARQHYVLEQMRDLGFLSEAELELALHEPLVLVAKESALSDVAAPYFVETVRRYLAENYGDEQLLQHGLKVVTSLNMRRQRAAEAAVRNGLDDLARRLGFEGPVAHLSPEQRRRAAQEEPRPFGPLGFSLDDEAAPAASPVEPKTTWLIEERGAREPSPARAKNLAAEANAVRRAALAKKRDSEWLANDDVDPDLTYAAVVESLKPVLRLSSGRRSVTLPPGDELVLSRWRRDDGLALAVGDVVPVRFQPMTGKNAGKLQPVLAQAHAAGVQSALIALDPRNGHVEAMVGGYDYRASQFNRAVQARRQIGSAMKPFIYAAAVEHGMTEMTIKYDVPVKFKTASGVWAPHNYKPEYLGAITLRTALAKSINTVSAQLVSQLGVDAVVSVMRRMGIRSALPHNLSLSLGTPDLGLEEVAFALSPFATGGNLSVPVPILQIVAADGTVLEDHRTPPPPKQVLDPEVAYVVGDLMKGVVEAGTGKRAQELGRPVLGKTGTSTNYRDAWFFGLTPQLVCGVWVGRDDFRPLAHDATGGHVALPIWLAFMKSALERAPLVDLSPPPGILFARADPLTGAPASPDKSGSRLIPFRRGTLPAVFRGRAAEAKFSDESF